MAQATIGDLRSQLIDAANTMSRAAQATAKAQAAATNDPQGDPGSAALAAIAQSYAAASRDLSAAISSLQGVT